MKKIIITLAIIIALIGVYLIGKNMSQPEPVTPDTGPVDSSSSVATSTRNETETDKTKTVIGTSVEGRDIIAYHHGTGPKEILFVGGIHGGYSWNTAAVAYQLTDYIKANPGAVPANVKVTVIPVLNPDGLSKVVSTTTEIFSAPDISASASVSVASRFNGRNVDLNRNFDCDWKTNATWQNKPVSGGSAAFSEPESQAIRNYVEKNKPAAVVVWYSAAGGVYASNCHGGVLPETDEITKVYADASGYPGHKSFDFYAITGDMVNWLAKNNIPAISVLLTNHTDTEWSKNQAGAEALIKYYSNK